MQHQTSPKTAQDYTHAAYCFARNLLWPDAALTNDDIHDAHSHLNRYFQTPERPRILIWQFYSRVIEEVLNHSAKPARLKDLLNPRGKKALTYYDVTLKDRNVPGRGIPYFANIVHILIENHLAYVAKPSPSILYKCKAELDKIGKTGWIELFYSAVQAQPFSKN